MLHYFAILTANRMDNYDNSKVYKPVFASVEVDRYVFTHKDVFVNAAIANVQKEVGSFITEVKVEVVYSEYYTISDMNDIFRKDSIFGNAYLVKSLNDAAEYVLGTADTE